MLPKKSAHDEGKEKRKTMRATIGLKKEIIAEQENGIRFFNLGLPKSTISTFLKNKEMIKAVAKGSKVISKHRPQIIEEVKKLLLVFINVKQLKGDSLSEAFICEKTLDTYCKIVENP